jgi:hypothetical protein
LQAEVAMMANVTERIEALHKHLIVSSAEYRQHLIVSAVGYEQYHPEDEEDEYEDVYLYEAAEMLCAAAQTTGDTEIASLDPFIIGLHIERLVGRPLHDRDCESIKMRLRIRGMTEAEAEAEAEILRRAKNR